jgi:hypothetical protein
MPLVPVTADRARSKFFEADEVVMIYGVFDLALQNL